MAMIGSPAVWDWFELDRALTSNASGTGIPRPDQLSQRRNSKIREP